MAKNISITTHRLFGQGFVTASSRDAYGRNFRLVEPGHGQLVAHGRL